MTLTDIKASISADVAAGVGELIESAVKEWANCQSASVDTNGDIWIEGPQSGHWLSGDKIVEFWAWNCMVPITLIRNSQGKIRLVKR